MVQLKSDAVFDKIKDRLAENPAKGKQINAVFLYKITNTTSNGAPVKQWSKSKCNENPNYYLYNAKNVKMTFQLKYS